MTHVPYKGENPALIDVMGGQLAFMFCNLPIGLPHAQSGKLRALAIATRARTPLAPDIPDHHRIGPCRLRGVGVEWAIRAGAHAARSGGACQCRRRAHSGHAGDSRAHRGPGRHSHHRHAGATRRIAQIRGGEVDTGGEGVGGPPSNKSAGLGLLARRDVRHYRIRVAFQPLPTIASPSTRPLYCVAPTLKVIWSPRRRPFEICATVPSSV